MHQQLYRNHGSIDNEEVHVTKKEIFKLIGMFEHKFFFFFNLFLSLCNGILPSVMQKFMGDMTSRFPTIGDGQKVQDALKPMIFSILYTNIAQMVFMLVRAITSSYSSSQFTGQLRRVVFISLMKHPISYFDQKTTGALMSRLSEDVALCNDVFVQKLNTLLMGVSQLISGLVLAFSASWLISLIAIVIIPIILVINYIGEKIIEHVWSQYNDKSTMANTYAEQAITQFRTVKAFDGEMKEEERFAKSLKGMNEIQKKASIVRGGKDALITVCGQSMTIIVFFLTSYGIIRRPKIFGTIEMGDSMMIMMGLMFAQMGATLSFAQIENFRSGNTAAAKLFNIIESEPKEIIGSKTLKNIKGKIEFRDVSFKYPTREEYALKHLSFTINEGENVAFVGESGCGKSTTLALLERFYEIEEGEILLDDVNVRELSPNFLRSQIAPVPQTPVLFSMSIADNIKFGRKDATDTEVSDAAQAGNAHNFIMAMKNNYKEEVQQTTLSGGQKQRICISRAILANTPIIILDEATAALDTESEALVQESIEKIRHGKTAIIVAHRLSTVLKADRILVFQNGTIVEEGTHKELLDKDGVYAKLIKFQLQ